MERLTLDEMQVLGMPSPARLLIAEDGATVSTLTPLGVTEEPFPVFSLDDRAIRIESKDVEWTNDGLPSIDGELRFLIIHEGTDL